MRRCAVCKKIFGKGSRSMFRVPRNDDDRRKWGEICGINFKESSQVCSDHFYPSCLVRVGKTVCLVPNAEPFYKETQKAENMNWVEVPASGTCNTSVAKKNITAALNNFENKGYENRCEEYTQNLTKPNRTEIPQLQEEHLIDILDTKSFSCDESTQTNTQFCGIVEILELSDELRLNCFYCAQVFPLEKWKTFANHLRDKHFEIEEVFKSCKYIADDHDYTYPNLKSTHTIHTTLEPVVNNSKKDMPALRDPLEPPNIIVESTSYGATENKMDSKEMFLTTNSDETETTIPHKMDTETKVGDVTLYGYVCALRDPLEPPNIIVESTSYGATENKMDSKEIFLTTNSDETETTIPHKMDTETKQSYKKSDLSQCLVRTDAVKKKLIARKVCKYDYMDIVRQNMTEISLECTPPDILDYLLDSMKNYPVLWQFDEVPYNEQFYVAVEDLCKIVNDKWSLNIDHLNMRRSINRILRFYCHLFPNDNIDQFNQYYEKCATFLPALLNEIAYARCTHCYICYRNDFDLKNHLLEEYKYLQFPYKCAKCKKSFTEIDEYEFHVCKEIFRCEPCNKTFFDRNRYNAHVAKIHKSVSEYKCNICDKVFQNRFCLYNHKIIHGDKKHRCHLCPNSYYNKGKLNLHLKLHRREYNFMCEFCGKKVFSQSLLKQHMKKHTGEKITCNICNLKLRKSSLKRHLKLLHVAYEGTIETTLKGRHVNYRRLIKSSPFRQRKKKSIVNKLDCKICKITFENYESVVEHNKELHPDIPKWSCKMCIMDFSLKRGLKRHYRRKHNLQPIQICKLVDENKDLNLVLSYDMDHLDQTVKILRCKNKEQSNGRKSNARAIKSDLLLDENYIIEEKDQILKSVDILTQADFFAEFLEN